MKKLMFTSLLVSTLSLSASASITLQSGQVIGPDGAIYDGMSPQTEAALLESIEPGETRVGVVNNSLYVIVNDEITTVPLSDLQSLDSDSRLEYIKDAIKSDYLESGSIELSDSLNHSEVERELEHQSSELESEMERYSSEIESEIAKHETEIEQELSKHEAEIENELSKHETEIEHQLAEHKSEIESTHDNGAEHDDHDSDGHS
jgi:hypothetical protein